MSDIYTGIDIGTDSIKIVVCEKSNDKYWGWGCNERGEPMCSIF